MGMFLFCPILNSFIFLYKSSNNKKNLRGIFFIYFYFLEAGGAFMSVFDRAAWMCDERELG